MSTLAAELGLLLSFPRMGRSKGVGGATKSTVLDHWPAQVVLLLLLRFWRFWVFLASSSSLWVQQSPQKSRAGAYPPVWEWLEVQRIHVFSRFPKVLLILGRL